MKKTFLAAVAISCGAMVQPLETKITTETAFNWQKDTARVSLITKGCDRDGSIEKFEQIVLRVPAGNVEAAGQALAILQDLSEVVSQDCKKEKTTTAESYDWQRNDFRLSTIIKAYVDEDGTQHEFEQYVLRIPADCPAEIEKAKGFLNTQLG